MTAAHSPVDLPVRRARDEIVNAMSGGGAMVLSAATGSGKTTQVPQMLLESGCVQGQIVVLEPRRLAARMTARRVAEEMGVELGGAVGFQTRFERAVSKDTRIRFVTDGVFLRQARNDAELRGIGAVVLDEFHERSLFADVALGLVRRVRETRGAKGSRTAPLALGVMSATLDVQAVAGVLGARAVVAEGRAFPVEIRFQSPAAGVPVWDAAARAVCAALDERAEGDALVFMPGAYEIDRTVDAVRALLGASSAGVEIVALHGSMRPEAQDRAVAPATRGKRKVIVATNVAETSITIPGVRIVVDAGTARVFRRDPRRGLNALRTEPVSRASADQRAGRAGRTAPGLCVRLWSERDHALRPPDQTPEVKRIDLAEAMLMLGGPRAFREFPWLDTPEAEPVARAEELLVMLGAADAGGGVTDLGTRMAKIPAHPRLARALMASTPDDVARVARWCAIAAEREVVQDTRGSGLMRLTPDGEPPSDIAAREELVRRVARSNFRDARHEGVEANLGACREVVAGAAELERAAGDHARGGKSTHAPSTAQSAATSPDSFARASRALIAGFPDHIAWRMDAERPHCMIAGRKKVSIDRDSIQRGAGFVLALEVAEGGRGDATHQSLRMVTPLLEEWIEQELPGRIATRIEKRFSEELGAPAEFEERVFDECVISTIVRPLRGEEAKAAAHGALAERIANGSVRPAKWDENVDQWIERVRCAAEWFPERSVIRYDADDLGVIAAELAHGCTRAAQLDERPVLDIVRNALDWKEQQWVERVAPATIQLPSGYRMRVTYAAGKAPTGRAKIQDFYDVKGHPSVADGRVKLRLELLGPNFRPVQITDDLPGFWERLYPEVKKELKRRYPRHEWR